MLVGYILISVEGTKSLKVELRATETRCRNPDRCLGVMGLRSFLSWMMASMAMVIIGMNINRDNGKRVYPYYSNLCFLGQTIVAPESQMIIVVSLH